MDSLSFESKNELGTRWRCCVSDARLARVSFGRLRDSALRITAESPHRELAASIESP